MKTFWKLVEKLVDSIVAIIFGNVTFARWKGVAVGTGCRLYIREFGTEPFLITIGNRVTITPGCRLVTHDGSTCLIHDENGFRYQHYAPIRIGDDVFVGINSIVLPGVNIGSRVIVGAGSVITKDIPNNSVVAGNPAKILGSFNDLSTRVQEIYTSDRELQGITDYRSRVERAIHLERLRAKGRSDQGRTQ